MTQNQIDIVAIKSLDMNKIKFSDIKPGRLSSKTVFLNYNYHGKKTNKLKIQFPKSAIPFGVSGFDSTLNDSRQVTRTSSDNININVEQHTFDKIREFEDKVISYMYENHYNDVVKITKNHTKLTELAFRDKFKSALKEPAADKNYKPVLSVKLIKKEGDYTATIYDKKTKKLDLTIENHADIVPRYCSGIMVTDCYGIWIVKNEFGISWRLDKMKVYPNDTNVPKASFLSDDEDEDYDDNDGNGEGESEGQDGEEEVNEKKSGDYSSDGELFDEDEL